MALNSEFIVKMPLIQKVIILGAIILLIVLGYYFFVHTKMVEDLAAKKKDLKEKTATLDSLKRIEDDIKNIRKQIALKERDMEKLKEKLPTEAEMEKLLLDMSEKAKQTGLVFSEIRPTGERPGPGGMYNEVPISLKFSGPYKFVMNFFSNVAQLDRIINFSGLSVVVSEAAKRSNSFEVQVACLATTYKFVITKPAPKAAAKEEGPKTEAPKAKGKGKG